MLGVFIENSEGDYLNDVMNRFGDNLSVGPRGKRGKSAFDLIQWVPHAALRMFRESEKVNIYCTSETDGIIFEDKKPVALKNRGLGPNAVSMHAFPKITRIHHDKYCMEFNNSLFKVDPVLSGSGPSTVIYAITFKGLGHSEVPRYLFSNEKLTRGISVSGHVWSEDTYLTIHSAGQVKEIGFDSSEWNGLFIQYKCEMGVTSCKYIFNDQSGTLPDGPEDKDEFDILYIGGHPLTDYAYHAIGSFEMYHMNRAEYLDERLGKFIVSDILERVDE